MKKRWVFLGFVVFLLSLTLVSAGGWFSFRDKAWAPQQPAHIVFSPAHEMPRITGHVTMPSPPKQVEPAPKQLPPPPLVLKPQVKKVAEPPRITGKVVQTAQTSAHREAPVSCRSKGGTCRDWSCPGDEKRIGAACDADQTCCVKDPNARTFGFSV